MYVSISIQLTFAHIHTNRKRICYLLLLFVCSCCYFYGIVHSLTMYSIHKSVNESGKTIVSLTFCVEMNSMQRYKNTHTQTYESHILNRFQGSVLLLQPLMACFSSRLQASFISHSHIFCYKNVPNVDFYISHSFVSKMTFPWIPADNCTSFQFSTKTCLQIPPRAVLLLVRL